MALAHPKFNREPEFPIAAPYPDKSWEDPSVKPPAGAVSAPLKATVGGASIEYYDSQQAALNNALRNAITDGYESMAPRHDQSIELMRTARMEVLKLNGLTVGHVQEYVSGLKVRPPALGVEEVHEQSGLQTPFDELATARDRQLPSQTDIELLLTGELAKPCTKVREAEIYEQLRAVFQPIIDQARSSSASAGGPEGPFDAARCMLTGAHFMHADHLSFVKSELADPEGKVKKLQQLIKSHIRERDYAEAGGKLGDMQKATMLAVKRLEELVTVQNGRVITAGMSDADIRTFVKDFAAWQEQAEAIGAAVLDVDKRRIEILKGDAQRLREQGEERDKRREQEGRQFAHMLQDQCKVLEGNTTAQNEVFDEVLAVLQKLPKLHQEREKMLKELVTAIEDESMRTARHEDWLQLARTHEVSLDQAQRSLREGMQMVHTLQRFVTRVSTAVHERNIGEELAGIQLKEATAMLSFFRDFTLTAGDMLDRRERYLGAQSRQLQQLDARITEARETLDPDFQTYLKEREAVEKSIAQAREDIGAMTDTFTRWADDFKRTEDMLTDLGVAFDSPVVELRAMIAEREQRMVTQRRGLLLQQQADLEQDQLKAKERESDASAAQRKFEQEREDRLQTGGASPRIADEKRIAEAAPEQLSPVGGERRIQPMPAP
eukprot:TRINITY_DN7580_c0_g1_i1.p1 TRINITY_DN7580_c0_g1~~TRINITY_DN7580_c0_g1_i1.p1  ORF type:complete len:665 (+),score=232.55 TRINITY_DN7580_c0_g1_i1:83-2077(+)